MELLRERWERFWFTPTPATNLGLCRLLFFGSLFLYYLPHDFSAWAEVSPAFWKPIYLFELFRLSVMPGAVLSVVQVVWKGTLALCCIGLFTRPSTLTSFLLGIYLLGLPHNFGKVHHNDAVIVLVLGILALSRCGDGCSFDRLIRSARHRRDSSPTTPSLSGEYMWPVRMI